MTGNGPAPAGTPPIERSPDKANSEPAETPRVRRSRSAFAEEELRLVSALVVLLGIGLFLALPFVLSIGAVVFLPLVTALILTIVLSPLADRLTALGFPNVLAAFTSILVFLAILVLALALIASPAVALVDEVPAMLDRVGQRFAQIRADLVWMEDLNRRIGEMSGSGSTREVVLAGPSTLERVAFATPVVLIAVLLTFLMAFFMIEGRVRLREKLLLGRTDFGSSIKAARLVREVQDRVAAYILTVALINTGVGVVVALGAWAMGMQAPVMWGGLAALLNFLPYVGPVVMVGALALFGVGTSDTVFVGLVPAAAYLALHTVEANVVTPSVLGARFTMNPVMILIALSYFTWIWGFTGALLSVPILLTLTAFVEHVGKPNLIGFIFGERLFPDAPIEDKTAPART